MNKNLQLERIIFELKRGEAVILSDYSKRSKLLLSSSENFSELNFLSHFFVPTAKNIVIYSENISSMKSFPFFLWAFVLFGFYEINFKKEYIVFVVPFLTTFSYLIFFVETRYLVSAVPLLAIMSSLGYINLINRNNLKKLSLTSCAGFAGISYFK